MSDVNTQKDIFVNICDYSKPLDYQGGDQVLDRIKEYLGTTRRNAIMEVYGIKPNTMSTWSKREQTPFELAVRMNICEGVSLKWLLLGEGEMLVNSSNEPTTTSLKQFNLVNGELIPTTALELDRISITEHFNIPDYAIAIKTDNNIYIIDEQNTIITSGDYLIDMDGSILVTSLTRLPNNKILIDLYGHQTEIGIKDIGIKGKGIFWLKID